MNFSDGIKSLNQASAFELYRMRAAIDRVLDDPKWLRAIQAQLCVGQEVNYFDSQANTLKRGRVLEFRRKQVVLLDLDDARQWLMRVIPLTPYVSQLLHGLPRRSEWVFSSASKPKEKDPVKQTEKPPAKPLSIPRNQHVTACKVAGIDDLTLHGLRRSFKSLTEWLEVPVGVVAQIQGHKPSATAEKHYTVRPLDLLRVHHEKIEAWILEQAGIKFEPEAKPGELQLVA